MSRNAKISIVVVIGAMIALAAFMGYRIWERERIRQIASPHLTSADKQCEIRLEEDLKAIDQFFEQKNEGVKQFSTEALSWGSKWTMLMEYVRYSKKGQHEEFLKSRFEELVLQKKDLGELIEQTIRGYLRNIESIENRMLVNLKVDRSLPAESPIRTLDEDLLNNVFKAAIAKILAETQTATQNKLAADLVETMVGEVVAQMALKLAIYGAAGAAAPWTMGASLVIGVVIEQIISWVWDWYKDPQGELSRMLTGKLDEMRESIIAGSTYGPGLRETLRSYALKRSDAREKAVLAILRGDIR